MAHTTPPTPPCDSTSTGDSGSDPQPPCDSTSTGDCGSDPQPPGVFLGSVVPWSAYAISLIVVAMALFWPTRFHASPRPIMLLFVSLVPAFTFGHLASRFDLRIKRPRMTIAFSTVGAAAISFGALIILNALFPAPSPPPVSTPLRAIVASIVDEDCKPVAIARRALGTTRSEDLVYQSVTSDGKILLITRSADPVEISVTPLDHGDAYVGAVRPTADIHQEWLLGIDLITQGGTRKCQKERS